MSLRQLMSQQLTVQRMVAGSADAYGNQGAAEYGDPAEVLGFLDQQSTQEDLLDRDTTRTMWQAFLPADTVIGHLDYLNFNSQKFQVVGEPWQVFNPRTQEVSHIVVKLVSING